MRSTVALSHRQWLFHQSISQERSHISAESREMLTAATLLLSEISALSTTLMYHMMLQSEKCRCPLSKMKADCMSFMVPPKRFGCDLYNSIFSPLVCSVWVWDWWFLRVCVCMRCCILIISHIFYSGFVSCISFRWCDLKWGISYNIVFFLSVGLNQLALSHSESLSLHIQYLQCGPLSSKYREVASMYRNGVNISFFNGLLDGVDYLAPEY